MLRRQKNSVRKPKLLQPWHIKRNYVDNTFELYRGKVLWGTFRSYGKAIAWLVDVIEQDHGECPVYH